MKLQPFKNEKFNVRTITQDGEGWFVAKDVAEILGYFKAANMLKRLEADEKMNLNSNEIENAELEGISKNTPKLTVISESGLYKAAFDSQKPEATKFRKWVTSEVLPTIRKTGSFKLENKEDFPVFMKQVDTTMATSAQLIEAQNDYEKKKLEQLEANITDLRKHFVGFQKDFGELETKIKRGEIKGCTDTDLVKRVEFLEEMIRKFFNGGK